MEPHQQVSIGNYKGVMLCNRPFVSGPEVSNPAKGGTKAFVCGNVGDMLGVNVPISSKERQFLKPKKVTALVKHRKWLEELQASRAAELKETAEAKDRELEKKKRFADREAKMRALVRESRNPETDEDEKEKLRSRPLWALTRTEAEDAEALAEDDEADELLNFAQGLDFEKYIHDTEVSTLIENVRCRIMSLERDQAAMDALANRTASSVKKKLLTPENLQELAEAKESVARDDDALSVASKLLDDDPNVGAIHSKKSLTAMAGKVMDTIPEYTQEPAVAEPRVVLHTDDSGARLEVKSHIAKLPYMHRNPAV